jgi:uncharacterized membrane protein YfcA
MAVSAGFIAAFLVILGAAAVSGLTGFGLAVVAVPPLMLVFEPVAVVVLLSFVSLFTNVVIVQDSWREIELRSVAALLPWAAAGLVLGTEVLRVASAESIRLAVGLVVILSAGLLLRRVELPGAKSRWGTAVAGASSGVLSTSTGIAGPPVVLLFAARGFPRDRFRASNAAYFLALGVAVILALMARGMVEASHLWIAAALIPAALVGKMLGTALVKRLSNEAFRGITLGVVLLTGALGALTATWALL